MTQPREAAIVNQGVQRNDHQSRQENGPVVEAKASTSEERCAEGEAGEDGESDNGK